MVSTMTMAEPKVERIVRFPIDATHTKSIDAAIVVCIDPRWWNKRGGNSISSVQALVDAKAWTFVPLSEAGGIKVIASDDPADADRRETLLARIEQEIGLHHPRILALTVHRDCGAYGYAKAFNNDAERENDRLYGDLQRAQEVLMPLFGSRARIEFYVFDAEGIEQVSF